MIHYTDIDTHRYRLYNCSWRLLGEKHPHGESFASPSVAGTYFWANENEWLTLDQALVSSTLLTTNTPFLDEASLHILSNPSCLEAHSQRPRKFEWVMDSPKGVSQVPSFTENKDALNKLRDREDIEKWYKNLLSNTESPLFQYVLLAERQKKLVTEKSDSVESDSVGPDSMELDFE
ncbi:MAG: hypothetical protein H0T76_15975 [Nannocystis sp.]|nr:hypothetical protein [Nannocystis sp.]MBA3547981.1 hypothetical protein [Nannocystis sp.]